MKKAQYICFEGTEGVGKTTQTKKLVDYLRSKDYKVLQTKEPGIDLIPLTMTLRGIMLDNQYDSVLTRPAREFISQAIRSIHLERLIIPSLSEYDYIIQDRGILSGYAYGKACGNDIEDLIKMANINVDSADQVVDDLYLPFAAEKIYDKVLLLQADPSKSLDRAKTSKQEFETGDAMESRGSTFISKVAENMLSLSQRFNTSIIDVQNKNIEEVHKEILSVLSI
jgi:dTMP kinase